MRLKSEFKAVNPITQKKQRISVIEYIVLKYKLSTRNPNTTGIKKNIIPLSGF
jgi:hypothetical protein